MSSETFLNPDDEALRASLANRAKAGGEAHSFSITREWLWFKDVILGTLEDDALQHLKNAKSDEDRMKAQQMYLASQTPLVMLNDLIVQGKAAQQQLNELSTPKEGDENA